MRLVRACRELGLRSVAVYSDCDRTALHVRLADEACHLGGNLPSDSYLNIPRIIDAARRSGADAVHPGYGFLAENGDFARRCREAGLVFIGPSPEVIDLMGSKTAARRLAVDAGVPVVPGTEQPLGADVPLDAVAGLAVEVGYPLLVKAVAGGGGKGLRRVETPAELADAVLAARSEAQSSFADSAIYLERLLVRPRHIEVQLLGDHHGTVVPFVERECSIQRRHQKVIEESPSPGLSVETRRALTAAAAAVARRAAYTSAGTIEFLLDGDGRFYFLEMNTRLQVEHPVTELVTGVDLVHWQIRIARGERLELDAEELLRPRGHAIECRIYAEDPDRGFLPSPGRIETLRQAAGPGIREDSGVTAGSDVPVHYDSLISKLIVWGPDRSVALARLRRALGEYHVAGVETILPFFRWIVHDADFAAGRLDTEFIDRALAERNGRPFREEPHGSDTAAMAAAIYAYLTPSATALRSVELGSGESSAWTRQGRREGLH